MSVIDYNIGNQVLQLEKFDLKKLVLTDDNKFVNPRIAMIAKSGSGKSWIIREIMYYLSKTNIPAGTVIAPTDKMTKFFDDIIPKSYIHHEYKEDIIPRILHRQKLIIEKNEHRKKEGKKLLDPRAFLIMDDCMSTKHLWLKDPTVLSVFNEGRHYQLTFILAMQYAIGIQPELRNNFDFIFLLGEDTYSSRKKIYEHYAGVFPKYDIFDQVFNQVTDNYGCMVLDNRIRSTNIQKKVFWYRSKETPSFKIGINKCLEFHNNNYDPEHDKKSPIIDLSSMSSKRRQIVRVKMNNK
jgi:hypothetical protein